VIRAVARRYLVAFFDVHHFKPVVSLCDVGLYTCRWCCFVVLLLSPLSCDRLIALFHFNLGKKEERERQTGRQAGALADMRSKYRYR